MSNTSHCQYKNKNGQNQGQEHEHEHEHEDEDDQDENQDQEKEQEKLLIIHRLSDQMIEESMEEILTPGLQNQEDIQYLQNLLQVSITGFCDEENA